MAYPPPGPGYPYGGASGVRIFLHQEEMVFNVFYCSK